MPGRQSFANKPIMLDAREIAKNSITCTVRLKGHHWWRLGLWLVRLGTWIAGIPVEIEHEDEDQDG